MIATLFTVLLAAGEDTREDLEKRFQESLNNVELVGYFTAEDAPADRPLSEDRYTISRVTKVRDDLWQFDARIRYGKFDMTLPIVLSVLWAGDTPMISLTDFTIPQLGSFTARILFHGDQYAGIWSGGGKHRGQMFGRIVKAAEAAQEAPAAESSGEDPPAAPAPGKEQDGARDAAHAWPSYRGPQASGVAEGFPTPTHWDRETGEHVLWERLIPGLAHSAPVVWGDRVFVTSAVREEGEEELLVGLYGDIVSVPDEGRHAFELSCLDVADGEILWNEVAWEGVPKYKRHPKGSYAASTPATNGEYVVAFFGTEGLYCFDSEGILAWEKDLGDLDSGFYMVPDAQWGFASSPVIAEDRVIVQCDVQQGSFVAAYRLKDGEEIWRTAREEVPTWSTPTVSLRPERRQVILNGYRHIGAYDFDTGAELWKLEGGGDIPVPTPVLGEDLVFITNAHGRMAPVYAIALDAEGKLTLSPEECPSMAWSDARGGIYMQTPLLYEDLLYLCSDAGILTTRDPRSGEIVYQKRLGAGMTGFTASAVAADDKVYFTSEEGSIHVVAAGRDFNVLAVNDMGEECMATPAISAGTLFIRTRSKLVALREDA